MNPDQNKDNNGHNHSKSINSRPRHRSWSKTASSAGEITSEENVQPMEKPAISVKRRITLGQSANQGNQ